MEGPASEAVAALQVSFGSDGVLWLKIDNAKKKNALDDRLLQQIDGALSLAGVKVIVIAGAGRHFCSGYDLKVLERWAAAPTDVLPDVLLGQVLDRLETHAAPSLALIDGVCFGAGCELACACDFRIATKAARFCMPPAKLGIVYAQKGLERVVRKSSLQTARRLFLTASELSGEEAFKSGLVDNVDDALSAAAQPLIDSWLTLSQESLFRTKQTLHRLALGLPPEANEDQIRAAAFTKLSRLETPAGRK